jgi:hypothetical protein
VSTRFRAAAAGYRRSRRERSPSPSSPPLSGIKRFRYRSWAISDDLRGNDDRYTATGSGSKRMTWLFGDA